MKIRSKANLLIVTVVLAMFVPLSSLMLHFQERSLRETALDTADSAALNAAQLLAGMVQSSQRLAEALAASSAARAPEGARGVAQVPDLRRWARSLDFRDGVLVLDRRGKVVQDPLFGGEMVGLDLSAQPFFRRTMATQAGVVSEPYRSLRSGRPVLTFTEPIRAGDGSVAGLVACNYALLDPGPFDLVREQKLGRTGYLYVVDRSRRMILHPDPSRILAKDIPPGANALLDRAVQGGRGAGATTNSRGVPMFAAYHQVAGTPWTLVAQIPVSEAYAAIPRFRRLMLLATGVCLFLLLGLGMAAVQHFTRPIGQLHAAVRAFRDAPSGAEFPRTLALLDAVRTGPEEFATLAQTTQHLLISRHRNAALLRQAAEEWERTFDAVAEALLVMDDGGRILRLNRTACDWFRTSGEAAAGQDGKALVLGPDATGADWPAPAGLDPDHARTWSDSLPGRGGVYEFRAAPLAQDGSGTGLILAIRDITEQARQTEQVRQQALFDGLTGLPNRLMLTDRLDQALALRDRSGGWAAVLFVDLDRFKEVNDSHGHDAGDALLREAARRMVGLVRRNDTVARLGGDEFVLVLGDLGRPEHAMRVAAKLVEAMAEPFDIDGHRLQIGASVGVALAPEDGRDGAELLQRADAAMYQAKRSGRSACWRYGADRGEG
jgi:diguanylate cyclase (GGDEF)-like protein